MIRPLLAVLLLPALAACATLRPADAPVTMRLSPTYPASQAPPMLRSIAVGAVQARGVTGHSRYVYVTAAEPAILHEAATLFWEEPPPSVLQRALIAGLQTRFATVTGPGMTGAAEWRVVPSLTRFEEVSGTQAQAVVSFDAVILHQGQAPRSGHYCGTARIGDAGPATRANAFDAAIAQAVGALVQDMAGTPVVASSC